MIIVSGEQRQFRVDSGADESVTSEVTFEKLFVELSLQTLQWQLSGPHGQSLKAIAKLPLLLAWNSAHSLQDIVI